EAVWMQDDVHLSAAISSENLVSRLDGIELQNAICEALGNGRHEALRLLAGGDKRASAFGVLDAVEKYSQVDPNVADRLLLGHGTEAIQWLACRMTASPRALALVMSAIQYVVVVAKTVPLG